MIRRGQYTIMEHIQECELEWHVVKMSGHSVRSM